MFDLRIFGLEFENTIVIIKINALNFAKFEAKIKISKFGTKMFCLGIFWLEFENIIVIFEISTL